MNPDRTSFNDILLVEDDPQDIELMLTALKDHLASKVVVVQNGAEALDYLFHRGAYTTRAGGHPSVVLLDNKMPKVSGLEVLKTIRGDGQLKRIPVVAFTSSRQTPELIAFYENGINAYVVKPMNFSEFMAAVRQLGSFWATLNEPPPQPGREETSLPTDTVVASGKEEVKNEIPAPHPALGG